MHYHVYMTWLKFLTSLQRRLLLSLSRKTIVWRAKQLLALYTLRAGPSSIPKQLQPQQWVQNGRQVLRIHANESKCASEAFATGPAAQNPPKMARNPETGLSGRRLSGSTPHWFGSMNPTPHSRRLAGSLRFFEIGHLA